MKVLNQRKIKTQKFKVSWLYAALTIIFLLPVSCNRAPENVLSQREMIVFLTELHKLDGTLTTKGLTTIDDRENIYYYNALLAKHKISKEQFDSSLVWYTRRPKQFTKIYRSVLVELNREDSLLRIVKSQYDDSVAKADKNIDIWNKDRMFTLTKDSALKQIDFEIIGYEFFPNDMYELKFLHRSSPTDSAIVEKAILKIHYDNNFTDSICTSLVADSLLRRYTLRFKARHEQKIERITGTITQINFPEKRKRTVVDSITLHYKYSPPVHDAMRLKLKNDTIQADAVGIKRKLPHLPYSNKSGKQ